MERVILQKPKQVSALLNVLKETTKVTEKFLLDSATWRKCVTM